MGDLGKDPLLLKDEARLEGHSNRAKDDFQDDRSMCPVVEEEESLKDVDIRDDYTDTDCVEPIRLAVLILFA